MPTSLADGFLIMIGEKVRPLTVFFPKLFEEDNARRVAVDEVLASDGADLSHGEESGDGDGAEAIPEDGDVVARVPRRVGSLGRCN